MGRVIKAGVAGGIVLFIWSFISWAVLTWHHNTMHSFADGSAVAQVIADNAQGQAVYFYPNMPDTSGMSADEAAAAEQEMEAKMAQGPMFLVAFDDRGVTGMTTQMVTGFVTVLVGALLVAWMLGRTSGLSYGGKLAFIMVFAVAFSVLAFTPEWNWFGFATDWTLVMFADALVGWFLAGLVMAKLG